MVGGRLDELLIEANLALLRDSDAEGIADSKKTIVQVFICTYYMYYIYMTVDWSLPTVNSSKKNIYR